MSAHASRSRLFRALFTGALVSALTSALIGLPTAARAATRPDLTVSALTLTTRHLVRGGALRVTETTHDAGATAPSTWTRYWLSRDRTHSTSDRLLGSRAVPKLRPARHSSFAKSWTIPASTGTGTWYVVACADASHKVRESRESNNCRASASLTVTAPAPPVVVDTTFPISPNPSKVTPSFGTGTVTTGIANAFADDPNSFTVTGPDGTTYTLDIPAQAFKFPKPKVQSLTRFHRWRRGVWRHSRRWLVEHGKMFVVARIPQGPANGVCKLLWSLALVFARAIG